VKRLALAGLALVAVVGITVTLTVVLLGPDEAEVSEPRTEHPLGTDDEGDDPESPPRASGSAQRAALCADVRDLVATMRAGDSTHPGWAREIGLLAVDAGVIDAELGLYLIDWGTAQQRGDWTAAGRATRDIAEVCP